MATPATIAHYRITAKLGEGGMGAVYRAHDTKLNREVAIKVLPDSFSDDRDRLARFTREAHVLASLNHPNIAAIYGVEDRALVMELVEGATLVGPLPVESALSLVHQLIDALEYAHDKGVVHRDLKLANINVTPEGRLKVLDFGLAKAMSVDEPAANPAVSPTLTMRATRAGEIMGTAAYMAPEQARGQVVDKRADIWAFGVVVYELLTGRPLFHADNISDILVQVLSKEIEFGAVPLRVQGLLRRCLERDPRKRLRDIGDARAMLDEPAFAPPAAQPAHPARLPWLVAAAAVFATCVIGTMSWLQRPQSAPSRAPLFHFTIDIPFGIVSPDGRFIVSAVARATNGVLRVRSLDNTAWRPLAGTEGGQFAFWAEDSSALAFFSDGRLRSISLDGSNLRNLAAANRPAGGAWRGGSSGTILFASGDSLRAVDLQSGGERLVRKSSGGADVHHPAFLPDGDGFVYLSGSPAPRLLQSSLTSQQEPREYPVQTARTVAFARDPHTMHWNILYIGEDDRTLLARRIHPGTGTILGPPRHLLNGISGAASGPSSAFGVSQTGVMMWRNTRHALPVWRLRRYDKSGQVLNTFGDPAAISGMSLSPDETRAVVARGFPTPKLAIYDLNKGAVTDVLGAPGMHRNPLWSPGGDTLYYVAEDEEAQRIIRQESRTGGRPEVIYEETGSVQLVTQDVSPDGRTLIVTRVGKPGVLRLDLTAEASHRKPEELTTVSARHVKFSRDGRALWIISSSTDISVLPYPPNGERPKQASSTDGNAFHFLSRDGTRMYQFTQDAMFSQAILAGGRLGERTMVFPVWTPRRVSSNVGAETRDGQFLIASTDAAEEFQMQILSDWTTLLKQ